MDAGATTVEFPLRGEWEAEHTPAERVPSHGTHQLGQAYAFDFVRIERDRKGLKFFRRSMLRYLLVGVTLDECYGWAEPIHASFSGTVVVARDGWPERQRLHLLRDLAVVLKNAVTFDPRRTDDFRPVLGNHVILKMPEAEIYALFAHARSGSIQVCEGDEVYAGQQIAEVGHSGNSTAPHLHFQLMDSMDVLEAAGMPCCFEEYESFHDGAWRTVAHGVPGRRERIRRSA